MQQKLRKKLMFLIYLHLTLYREIVFVKNRILFIHSGCVNKQSEAFSCQLGRLFPAQWTSQWSMNMIKVMWCNFKFLLARLPCCLWKGPLKRDFLDIYLTTFKESVISEIQKLWGSSFVWKCPKFNLYFKNAANNCEKVFCFWDNCIWIGIVKLSPLGTGNFSLPANVLTSSLKIFHVNKKDFLELNWLDSEHWI